MGASPFEGGKEEWIQSGAEVTSTTNVAGGHFRLGGKAVSTFGREDLRNSSTIYSSRRGLVPKEGGNAPPMWR
jgi:hypothetical protein